MLTVHFYCPRHKIKICAPLCQKKITGRCYNFTLCSHTKAYICDIKNLLCEKSFVFLTQKWSGHIINHYDILASITCRLTMPLRSMHMHGDGIDFWMIHMVLIRISEYQNLSLCLGLSLTLCLLLCVSVSGDHTN